MPLIKTAIRVGVIGTLVGGGLLAVAGPDRVGAALSQARERVNNAIDSNIDDPVRMRAQLRKLESQYPERIARVRQDLASLDGQVSQYERELAVARRVVELAQADLDTMRGMFDQASDAMARAGGAAVVRVRFDGSTMDLDDARARAVQIQKTRDAYASKADDIERDLELLGTQRERLEGLLTKLESERSQFQAELWRLNQQIDAIARNERMIEMMEARQKTLDELGPYQAHSVDQIKDRLSRLRDTQEQRLESLASGSETLSYEERAKLAVETDPQGRREVIELAPRVIELQAPKADADGDDQHEADEEHEERGRVY